MIEINGIQLLVNNWMNDWDILSNKKDSLSNNKRINKWNISIILVKFFFFKQQQEKTKTMQKLLTRDVVFLLLK